MQFDRALQAFRQVVVARGLHLTSARQEILQAVMAQEGHFDVPKLGDTLRAHQRRPKIALATLYRSMPLMLEAGIVRQILHSQSGSASYEVAFERPPEDLIICTRCGAVEKFHLELLSAIRRDIAAMHAFELESHVHEMRGICAKCRAKPAH